MRSHTGVQFASSLRSPWICAVLVCLFLGNPVSSHAQSVWAEAGISTLLHASGFQVNYRWAPVEGWIGGGWQDGFSLGGFVQTRVDNYDVGVGDRYQPLVLDTDVFDQSRYFAGRGVSLQRHDESRTLSVFAGATADERSTNFFRTFTANQPTGGVFYEQQFGTRLSFHSIDLVQDSVTSIQSFHYKASQNFDVSAAGGVGQGGGFLSFAAQMQRRLWQLTASYTDVGDTFQRISGVLTNAPERVGLNVRFRYQPKRKVNFTLGHENLMSPTILQNGQPQKVSFDSVNAGAIVRGFHLGGGLSTSSSGDLHATSESASVSRNVVSNVTASGSLLRIDNRYQVTNIVMGSVQERIGPRLTINEGISSQTNSKTFTWGAHWVSNRISIGVQQDMLYTPLAGGFDGKPYTNAWAVNLIAPMPRAMRLHLDSYVDPAGKMRYTAWIDGIGWSRNGVSIPHDATPMSSSFGRFVVTGVVQEPDGKPVFGIAVQVDGQTAFSDNTGHFFLRFSKGLTYPLAVLPDRSLAPQYYEVVQAPVSATAETEDAARPILIVVRRGALPKKHRSDASEPESAGTAPMAGK